MEKSEALPKLKAPPFRSTTSADTWTSYLKGDLREVVAQARLWVRVKTKEVIEEQIRQGNSEQHVTYVDGNKSKSIDEAQKKTDTYFVAATLTHGLGKAKEILARNILRFTNKRSGRLANDWTWFFREGGKGGTFRALGDSLPTDMSLRTGDVIILAPRAGYAWFANHYAKVGHTGQWFARKAKAEAKFKATGKRSRGRPMGDKPSGMGFMAATAKQLRPELKRIGIIVTAGFTKRRPPGPGNITRPKQGIPEHGFPILQFRMQKLGLF
jgi:hypothetical protein